MSVSSLFIIGHMGLFLLFVKPFKAFDEYYFEFSNPNKEIILFWTKV